MRERNALGKEDRASVFGRWGEVLRALEVRGREESLRHCVQSDLGALLTALFRRANILTFSQALQGKITPKKRDSFVL